MIYLFRIITRAKPNYVIMNMDMKANLPSGNLMKPKKLMKSKKNVSEPNNLNVTKSNISRKRKKLSKNAASVKQMKLESETESVVSNIPEKDVLITRLGPTKAEEKYPLLKDEELIKKFRAVPVTNNQKGRIRQILKDNLKGTSELILPDVIHNRIQSILDSNKNLNDTDLRKIRILYNMLKTSAENDTEKVKKSKIKSPTNKAPKEEAVNKENNPEKAETKNKQNKVKGPKRYVVFVGNLPLNIEKDMLINHFSSLKPHIKDVRLPKEKDGAMSSIAYIELQNEISYEMALSKHHSMLGNKRINVLYTAQKTGKISKTEAKSKSAKLVAMQKSGMLIGSTPLNRKRSQRRAKMKKARLEAEKSQQ